jgi:DNA-binding MarR family transcriptional regulator
MTSLDQPTGHAGSHLSQADERDLHVEVPFWLELCAPCIYIRGNDHARTNVDHPTLSIRLDELHRALLDIVGAINGPQRDQTIIDEAGIVLEQVLFPLLVMVDRIGPVGVVVLADRVGRDYTTVSRQLDRLARLGLIKRKPGDRDRRVSEAVVTPAGRAMNAAIDGARERLMTAAFASWSRSDVDALTDLMKRFAEALTQ